MTTDRPEWMTQKTLIGAVVGLVGVIGGGGLVGYTVEPQATTDLRLENATLVERASHMESQVSDLEARVEVLEELIEECRQAFLAIN